MLCSIFSRFSSSFKKASSCIELSSTLFSNEIYSFISISACSLSYYLNLAVNCLYFVSREFTTVFVEFLLLRLMELACSERMLGSSDFREEYFCVTWLWSAKWSFGNFGISESLRAWYGLWGLNGYLKGCEYPLWEEGSVLSTSASNKFS